MKTQNPWMGRARGSAGNMTSSKVFDKNVMRAKAFEVNNPKTAAQTNERNFFAEAQKICQTVSEEQLRSLFGVKPKSKSRRNALLTQLLGMFDPATTPKAFDPEKFTSIGSGSKVNVPFIDGREPKEYICDTPTLADLGKNATVSSILYLVLFEVNAKKIIIFNTKIGLEDWSDTLTLEDLGIEDGYYFGYLTIAEDGSASSDRSFGSFIIKTRAEK